MIVYGDETDVTLIVAREYLTFFLGEIRHKCISLHGATVKTSKVINF